VCHPQLTNIIGVSKWSCPVCSGFLLSLGEGFQVLGSHSTISACSLPLATPEPIIDDMIAHYSQQLRDDMVLFMPLIMASVTGLSFQEQQLQRISSTESQPMPLVSGADGDGVVDTLTTFWNNLNILQSLQQLTGIGPGN
jgi:hypothetical protein